MSNIFAQLLQEGDRQQKQLKQESRPLLSPKPVNSADSASDSTTAQQQAVLTDQQLDSLTARQHSSTHSYVQVFLLAKSTQKTTLRYPAALMNEIDDVIYQIKKTFGVSLSKNEIFVLALASVLHDFKRNTDHSLLTAELIHPKKPSS